MKLRLILTLIPLLNWVVGQSQPIRYLYTDNKADTLQFFPELMGQLTQDHSFENVSMSSLLADTELRLRIFEEPTFQSDESFILRVGYFPFFYGEKSQIIRIGESNEEFFAVCKEEGDNRIEIDDFRLNNMTRYEIKDLTKAIDQSDDEVYGQELLLAIDKWAIKDSLKFRYDERVFPISEYALNGVKLMMKELEVTAMETLVSSDLTEDPVHYQSSAIWVLEWSDNDIQKIVIRSRPEKEFIKLTEIVLHKCTQ
ncbi:MAG: hypothetical protein RIC35_14205 [Marinoscillum sp.]